MAAAVRTSTVLGASSAVAAVAIMRCKRRAGEDASCTAGQRRDAAARRGTAAAARCDRTHLATGLATVVNVAVEREDMFVVDVVWYSWRVQQLLLEAHIPTHFTRTLALKATPSVP